MEKNDVRVKLNGILEAIASGRSCEQILAADRTLSYRHIFHAVAEAPTTYWDKPPAKKPIKGLALEPTSLRTPSRQRAD
jgi:hypothetical protein